MTPTPDLDVERVETICAEKLKQWEKARPFIERALVYWPGHTIEDVLSCYLRGTVQLWVGERCAAVTEFLRSPRRCTLNVWLAGGDLREMQTMRAGMEAWARGAGCAAVNFLGRTTKKSRALDGWGKASGYEPGWVNYTRDL